MKKYLGLVAIFKNEKKYLQEWLNFHINMGIELFYMYDDESEDNPLEILQPYIDKGIVLYYPIVRRDVNGKFLKGQRWIHLMRTFEMHNPDTININLHNTNLCEWIIYVDIDEFVYPHNDVSLIENIKHLSLLPEIGGIAINCYAFGSNKQMKYEDNPVLERFTKRSKNIVWQTKCILKPEAVRIKEINNPHHIPLKKGYNYYASNGKNTNSLKKKIGRPKYPPNSKPLIKMIQPQNDATIVYNHYIVKSMEEWMEKIERYKYNIWDTRYRKRQFHEYNKMFNCTKDEYILRFSSNVKLVELLKNKKEDKIYKIYKMDNFKTKIIGEIGINHNGDIDLAKQMILLAKVAGCDYVKIQKRNPDVCVPEHQKSKIRQTPWGEMKYIDYKKKIEFGEEQLTELFEYAKLIDVQFFASVWDCDSVDVMKKYTTVGKIPSALITNLKLCAYARDNFELLIISTGMSTEEEIDTCVKACNPDVIMHTNSTYPCPVEDLNLRYIEHLKQKYPTKEIGYSGHEYGLVTTFCAVSLGATWVERHVTMDRNMWGSDQKSSIEPSGVIKLVKGIRDIEKAMQYVPGPRKQFVKENYKKNSLRKK